MLTVLVPPGFAQQDDRREAPVLTRARVLKVDVHRRRSPSYKADDPRVRTNEREWAQILVEYETDVNRGEYSDELTIEWAVALLPDGKKPIVMRREVTYLDVEKGKHYAVMYLRPRFVLRTLERDRINEKREFRLYMEFKSNGEVFYKYSYPEERPALKWWELGEPRVERRDQELKNRLETPFAPLDYDAYECIKEERNR